MFSTRLEAAAKISSDAAGAEQIWLNNCDDSQIIACSVQHSAAVARASSLHISTDHHLSLFVRFSRWNSFLHYDRRCLLGVGLSPHQRWYQNMMMRHDRNETHLDDNPGNYNKYFAIIHTNVVTLEFILSEAKHPSLHSVSQWDQKQNFVSILLRI